MHDRLLAAFQEFCTEHGVDAVAVFADGRTDLKGDDTLHVFFCPEDIKERPQTKMARQLVVKAEEMCGGLVVALENLCTRAGVAIKSASPWYRN